MADLLIIGAGSRGSTYASYAQEFPDQARVVGVAEPRAPWRHRLAEAHRITGNRVVEDWRMLADRPRFADAVVIATPDALHAEPAIAFARLGYHLLLEKPMARTPEDCVRIVEDVRRAGVLFAVCHVLRYTAYTRALRRCLQEGRIGDVVCIQHLEPVGYWHQAHSFVRGNWRREEESAPMLLAKCCHDVDWLRFLVGSPCTAVHSFGGLSHFRADRKPPGAGTRCLDCAVESDCPYSARKIYLERTAAGKTGWPVDVLSPNPDIDSVTEALHSGPYGRCVYTCDNDVVDHQVVNLAYAGGQTANLTMTAFTEATDRRTRIFGTRGELTGDGRTIRYFDFLTDQWHTLESFPSETSVLDGHGGGDFGLMEAFVKAVNALDPTPILSGPEETLETHLTTFAAEISRKDGRMVNPKEPILSV